MQGLKRRKARDDGNCQATSTSIKNEPIMLCDLAGHSTLGDIKAELGGKCSQPAPGAAEDIPSSKPAAGPRRNPGRAAAAAGVAKRTKSEAQDALTEPPAKRPRNRQAPQAHPEQLTAARQPAQPSSSQAVDVDGIVYVDVQPQATSNPCGKHAHQGQQEEQAVEVNGPGHETAAEQARRFGNLVGDAPQRIIISCENPSNWDRKCVPHVADHSSAYKHEESSAFALV